MDTTKDNNRKRQNTQKQIQEAGIALLPFSLALGIFIWYLFVYIGDLQPFILPTPYQVLKRFWFALPNDRLVRHTLITLSEVITGLALGGSLATMLGYILAKSRPLERFAAPYIVASQSIPTIAIAPLLVIWFGSGPISKILICALIVFFPILTNTIVGVRSVPKDLRDLMRSLRATRRQTFILLEIPASLPVFFGGLRVGATLSVIGAVVGEFVGSDRGLGFMINYARGQYDTALVFVAVFMLIGMALTLYGLVVLLESKLLSWQKRLEQTALTK
jgi:NitT/TauT family transport system permease protein